MIYIILFFVTLFAAGVFFVVVRGWRRHNKVLVLYHLPCDENCHVIYSYRSPRVLPKLCDVGTRDGFVISPYDVSQKEILLVSAENERVCDINKVKRDWVNAADCQLEEITSDIEREAYQERFQSCLTALQSGRVHKIVLSRRHGVRLIGDAKQSKYRLVKHLFAKACELYATSYVAVWLIPQRNECWLVASPELLLRKDGQRVETMALAGTMPADDSTPWTNKNVEEQAVVSRFIEKEMMPLSKSVRIEPTETLVAGKVKHLCTRFDISLHEDVTLGDVLSRLHPTPAVCGLPRAAAQDILNEVGTSTRQYYAGFSGPVKGEFADLYVTLRCMSLAISHDSIADGFLYAGGGLLKESEEQEEWNETQNKFSTIKNIFTQYDRVEENS